MEQKSTIKITDANFNKEVLSSDVPVLVDFWAEWCQPCRAIGPVIDEIAQEYNGKIKVGKLNVDTDRQTAMNFNIRSIPTLLFFKDGKVIDQLGAVSKSQLIDKIETLV